MRAAEQGADDEWRARWTVVLAAFGGMTIATINIYSVGLFIEPLQHAFGWSRAAIAAGPALPALTTVIFGPFLGAAIDRLGPRRIGLVGASAVTALTAALSLAGPGIWSWWGLWALLAVINIGITPAVWTSAVSGYFARGRGLALAVTLTGSGISSIVSPVLAFFLIDCFGWRTAYVGLAATGGATVLPLLWLFFTSPRDEDRTARVTPTPTGTMIGQAPARAVLASRRFLQLALAAFLVAAAVVPFALTIVPILSWNGLSRGEATGIAGLLGVSSIVGRLCIGWLLDRVNGRHIAAVAVSLPIVAVGFLTGFPGSVPASIAAVLVLGLALGAELDVVGYLASRYFGVQRCGLVFGTIGGLITLAGGGGPWVLNLVFDWEQSYLPALVAIVPVCVVSATLFLLLGPYPPLEPAADAADERAAE